MGTQFDWQTDAEGEWDKPARRSEPSRQPRGRIPFWLLFLITLFTLAGIGVWQMARRVDVVNDDTIKAIRTAHTLIHQAALTGDTDLFRTLLYRRDAAWYQSQQRLLQRHLFLDRAPLGLWALPLTATQPFTVTLAPDLQTAFVAAAVPYTAEIANDTPATILLRQITYYQKRNDYWLMTPLPDDMEFWGEWHAVHHPFLNLTYPERDAAISLRLAEDLSGRIATLCPRLSCPDDLQLSLRFTRDQDALWRLQERPQASLRQIVNLSIVYQMWLPTPTWVGLPVDETGYQALLHGYSNWVITRIAAQFRAGSVLELDQFLQNAGYHVPYPVSYQPYRLAEMSAPAWPTQDVLALCEAEEPMLYRYDPDAAAWHLDPSNQLWAGQHLTWQRIQFTTLPDDAGLLLWFEPWQEGRIAHQYWYWDGQAGTLLKETPFAFPPYLWIKMIPAPDQANRYLPLVYPLMNADGHFSFQYGYLPWGGCASGECQETTFNELPIWSPELGYAILSGMDGGLTHTDAAGTLRTYLGQGHSPFWLDENTFGYVRHLQDKTWEVTELVLSDRLDERAIYLQNEVVVTAEDLAAAATHSSSQNPLLIYQVIQNPTDPALLLILAHRLSQGTVDMNYLFTLNITTRQITFLARDRRLGEPILFSPNGRYVTRMAYQSSYWTLTTHDLYTGAEQVWTTSVANSVVWTRRYDWSEDERWLVLAEDDTLRLLAVGEDYEQRVLLPEPGCYAVSWVDNSD